MTTYHKAIVIGASSGGMAALTAILPVLPRDYPIPLIIAQHLHPSQGGLFIKVYDERCALNAKEADEKEEIRPGHIYFAPPNYHLLVENNRTFSLSIDPKVNYARPSIDVLFESAAAAYRAELTGILLTGANNDGALGLKRIKENGGLTVVQDPATAECPFMPQSALNLMEVDYVLSLEKIGALILEMGEK